LKYKNKLIALLILVSILRLLYVIHTPFDLSPDEAHYWEWSRRPGLSYYSKGPLVAWIIASFTALFGDTALSVRAGAVLFSALSSYLMYLLGRDVFESEKAGFYSALLPVIIPVFSIGSVLMTTDVLLVFFWAASVYSLARAVETERSAWWVVAGLSVGLGFLAKYTMVLLYPSVLILFIFSGRLRPWLRRPQPYMAGLTSLVLATPVIIWNIIHGQVTIRHTLGQAHVGSGAFSLLPALEFLGAQAALTTPVIFIGLVYGLWMCWKWGVREKRDAALLAVFASVPLFLFFLFKGLHGKVQANWAVASYVTAIPAGVWAFSRAYRASGQRRKRVLGVVAAFGLFLGATVTTLAYFPWTLEPVWPRVLWGPPYNRVMGWAELGERVSEAKEELGPRTFIMSDSYQVTSELAMYTEGNPVTFNAFTGARRMNQYDLWPGFDDLWGFNAVYVKAQDEEIEPVVAQAFEKCDKELFTIYRNEEVYKTFSIFSCSGFKGMEDQPVRHMKY